MTATITASDIVRRLADRHTKDVFVPECKDGPTWAGKHSRLDAWAMKRSWSTPCVWGYEVKVSRSDFLQDEKWPSYLTCCNQFYFVCPDGLIKPTEIPGNIGLIYASASAKRLRVLRKAEHREAKIPESLFIYLLMCRTRVVGANHYDQPTRTQKIEEWRAWLSEKREAHNLGYQVSRRINDHVSKVHIENVRLKAEMEKLAEVKKFCTEAGIRIHGWDLKNQMKHCLSVIPEDFLTSVAHAEQALQRTRTLLETLRKGQTE
jgi:hypothetical protein